MLSARSSRDFAGSRLDTAVFLERKFRVHLVRRDRLLYDSAFAPAARKSSPFVHLYATLRGTFHLAGSPPITGPQCYVLAESEFERVAKSSHTFRSYGEPAVIVELRLPARELKLPVGLVHGPVTIPPEVWRAYQAVEANPVEPVVLALIDALAAANLVTPELVGSVVREEPEHFVRLWSVLRPLYEELQTSASLKQIAVLSKLSLRQLGRDLASITKTFGLFGLGFRDAMRVLRLRAAVLLLSAPSATPSDVARAVGYGSLDAMGRAFRDADLAAPSIVQAAVRYGD